MKYEIELIENGVLITGLTKTDPKETMTLFCKTIHVAADVLTTWAIAGALKAKIRAKRLNIESSYKD